MSYLRILVLAAAMTVLMVGSGFATERVPVLNGNQAVFTSKSMVVEVDGGVVTRIFNRLTGTEFLVDEVGDSPELASALLYYETAKNNRGEDTLVPAPVSLGDLSLTGVTEDTGAITYTFQSSKGNSQMTLSFALDDETGDLLVTQRGRGDRDALGGIRFGIGPVTCRGNLLLPSYHGMKANTSGQYLNWEGNHWIWPWTWPLQLAIFDDTPGGFWIHSRDVQGRYKDLRHQYKGNGAWRIAFDTLNNAPLDVHTSIEGVTWRINVYEGDWTAPIDTYKAWAHKAYKLEEKSFVRPDWIQNIQLHIKDADHIAEDAIEEYLDLLATMTEPSKTLLYMKDWYEHSQPLLLPCWTISRKGIQFNEEARKRGFRTMYFSNFWAMSPEHPRADEFRKYFVRNTYTGQYEGWNLRPDDWSLASGETMKLHYVTPACKAWRAYQIESFRKVFDTSPADGLFLDQTYNIFNDFNGLVDGMTMIEGNKAFHRELAEALPGVALGGENISEITYPYEAFFEMHPLGFQFTEDYDGEYRWRIAPEGFDRMVPIMTRFLTPYTRPFGYLGYPETHSPFYPAWRDAVAKYDGIPTINRATFEELRDEDGEVRRVIRRAFR